jgi:hypothetical protein
MGFQVPPRDLENQDRERTAAKEALGEDAFTVALNEGRAMTLEQAIDYALEMT